MWETTSHNDLETSRSALLLSVLTTDSIYCEPWPGNYYEANSYYQNYLMGFPYNPTFFTQLAWSVGRTLAALSGINDYVVLNAVNVNTGGAWDAAKNQVSIPTTGVYIVDITSNFCGIPGNGNCNMQLLLNDDPIIDL